MMARSPTALAAASRPAQDSSTLSASTSGGRLLGRRHRPPPRRPYPSARIVDPRNPLGSFGARVAEVDASTASRNGPRTSLGSVTADGLASAGYRQLPACALGSPNVSNPDGCAFVCTRPSVRAHAAMPRGRTPRRLAARPRPARCRRSPCRGPRSKRRPEHWYSRISASRRVSRSGGMRPRRGWVAELGQARDRQRTHLATTRFAPIRAPDRHPTSPDRSPSQDHLKTSSSFSAGPTRPRRPRLHILSNRKRWSCPFKNGPAPSLGCLSF